MSEKETKEEETTEEETTEEEPETKPEEKSVEKTAEELKAEIQRQIDEKVAEAMEKVKKDLPNYKMIKENIGAETTPDTKETESEIAKFAVIYHPTQREAGINKVMPESSQIGKTYYGGVLTPSIDKRAEGARFADALDEYLVKYTSTTTGGAGTAGYALIPVYVDPDIIDRTRREIPFIEMLPRRATQGLTYDYNAITTLTNAVTLREDAALNDLTDVYDRFSTSMTYLYSTGRVSGPAIAARKGYVDALNLEVQNRTIGMKRYEDELCLQTTNTAPEMSSLADLISTNETALGGPTTISAMRTEITQCHDAGGVINLIVTTKTLEASMKGLMMDYQRWVDKTKIAWGIETLSFDGIPVVVDRYVPTGYIYFLDMSVIFMAVLQDIVYEELAKTNDSVKFTLKAYEALICRAEAFCSLLTGAT